MTCDGSEHWVLGHTGFSCISDIASISAMALPPPLMTKCQVLSYSSTPPEMLDPAPLAELLRLTLRGAHLNMFWGQGLALWTLSYRP